jgi:hypothetical protein
MESKKPNNEDANMEIFLEEFRNKFAKCHKLETLEFLVERNAERIKAYFDPSLSYTFHMRHVDDPRFKALFAAAAERQKQIEAKSNKGDDALTRKLREALNKLDDL